MNEDRNLSKTALCDVTMPELSKIIDTLQELERMHQLNLEMLEQLDVVFKCIIENDVQIPNADKFVSLLSKSQSLLKEIYFSSQKIMQYRKLTDESLQRKHNSRRVDRTG